MGNARDKQNVIFDGVKGIQNLMIAKKKQKTKCAQLSNINEKEAGGMVLTSTRR